MLKKLIEEERPDYLGVAFDLPGPTFRHRRFQAYKEHRPPMPEPLAGQIPWIKEVLKAYRIPLFEEPGFEADDILGGLTRQATRLGLSVVLVTGDKDLFQLLGPKVKVYRPTREGHEVIDEEALGKLWGVQPDQVVEVMALMGDKVDAIPGVPGIGEKTAVELIRRFGSVEKLLKELDEVPGAARRRAIAEHADQLALSRGLASLETEVPVRVDLEALERKEPDKGTLVDLFQRLEFRTLVKELLPEGGRGAMPAVHPLSKEELAGVLAQIRREGRAAVVAGMDPALPDGKEALRIGLAWQEGSAAAASGEVAFEGFRALAEDPSVRKICPGLKERWVALHRLGLSLPSAADFKSSWTDPSLASYLLDPARPSHRMEALGLEMLGESLESPDFSKVLAVEAEAALRLMPRLEEEIRTREQTDLLAEVEVPLSLVLARMECAGIAVDPEELRTLSGRMNRVLADLTETIYRQAGGPFNLNSPKQMAKVLFERLRMPVIKRTKTGASTDEGVLRRLAVLHELPAKILEYREMFKLSSTYVEPLPRLIRPDTGRIHSSFNQTVTATGRLSSSDPNLQNIPIRTEWGRQIRRAFVPSGPGLVFLSADYSQIELRILAHLSGDERLGESFRRGEDVHRVTAAEIFSVEPEAVDLKQRATAKTINFGIVYGMSPFGLSKELGMDPAQAESFIQRYFAKYPGVQAYLGRSLEEARRRGYCATLLNRRRTIPELHSKDVNLRQFAERTAVNTPIQGSAADLIKVAMVALDERLWRDRFKARMLLTVHDELVFEAPEEELARLERLVREVMEAPLFLGRPIRLSVPLEVNVKSGRNWLECSH